MKKAIVVIVAALYALSIVIIGFFGSEVRFTSSTKYVEDIVLVNESYKVGTNTIIQVNPRQNWTFENNKNDTKYTIIIRDYNYFYTSLNNTIQLDANAKRFDASETPDNSTLHYSIIEGDQVATIDSKNGTFAFNEKLTANSAARVKIESTDNSGIYIYVGITAIVV